MAMALPDAVVINRKSEDITVHRIDPNRSWFYQSPLVQRVMGGATPGQDLQVVSQIQLMPGESIYDIGMGLSPANPS